MTKRRLAGRVLEPEEHRLRTSRLRVATQPAALWEGGSAVDQAWELGLIQTCELRGERGRLDGSSGRVCGRAQRGRDKGAQRSSLAEPGALGDVAVDVPGVVPHGHREDGVSARR